MTRSLFIAAGAPLAESLAEQFGAMACDVRHGPPDDLRAPWPDAAVLDAVFCDAEAAARRLRAEGFGGAIIVIADPAVDISGADAVVARPFRFSDLAACLDAAGASPHTAAFADLRLTEKEAAILARLVEAQGEAISKSALLADVWGYGPNVSTRTLETHIHRLRRKIEADPKNPRKLLTEAGGYRVARINEGSAPALPET